jgi:Molecular chaperone (small heat shock protein)
MTDGIMEQDVLKMKDNIGEMFDNVLAHGAAQEDENYFWTPAVDVAETKDAFILKAALPGVKKEDVDTEIKEDMLTISGKTPDCKCGQDLSCISQELPKGNFYRAFKINARVKTNAVKASFKDGILEINIPKADEEKTNKVHIE